MYKRQEYLPKQFNEEDTKKICSEIIVSTGASSIRDMGKVMAELKKNHADSIDFSKVNLIVINESINHDTTTNHCNQHGAGHKA